MQDERTKLQSCQWEDWNLHPLPSQAISSVFVPLSHEGPYEARSQQTLIMGLKKFLFQCKKKMDVDTENSK